MNAIEYTTRITPDGNISLPPSILYDLNLEKHTRVRVLLLFEETTKASRLSRFAGKWQDERSADEIVTIVYSERQRNERAREVTL